MLEVQVGFKISEMEEKIPTNDSYFIFVQEKENYRISITDLATAIN